MVVHHTAGVNVRSSREVYRQRRSVVAISDSYDDYAVVNRWGDIGYNSLIGYEGRHSPEPLGDDVPLAVPAVAGDAYGYNNRTYGIPLMGDLRLGPVPDLEFDSLAPLVGRIVRSQLLTGGAIDPLSATPRTLSDGEVAGGLPNIVGHRDVVTDTECQGGCLYARLVELRDLAKQMVDWPPLHVNLYARADGGAIALHIFVQNHEPAEIGGLVVKGVVLPNAALVDSWAGSPGFNRGVFDGSIVVWNNPDATSAPRTDRREYVFVVRPRPGVDRTVIVTTAGVEFVRPTPGRATPELARADQPITLLADSVLNRTIGASGGWSRSTNVETYYGADYAVRPAGSGAARFDWLLDGAGPATTRSSVVARDDGSGDERTRHPRRARRRPPRAGRPAGTRRPVGQPGELCLRSWPGCRVADGRRRWLRRRGCRGTD